MSEGNSHRETPTVTVGSHAPSRASLRALQLVTNLRCEVRPKKSRAVLKELYLLLGGPNERGCEVDAAGAARVALIGLSRRLHDKVHLYDPAARIQSTPLRRD